MEEMRAEQPVVQEQVPETPDIDLKAYNLRQIEVARELYAKMHDKSSVAAATDNDVMRFWMDAGYSDTFRHIVRGDTFRTDSTLAGDISNVTADHVLHYVDPDHDRE